jgi:glycosyltransferase involved in cell wall biosynthesis
MNQNTQTSIIISAYNEESGLPVVLEQLGRLVSAQGGDPGDIEIIVVNDGSSDRTAETAANYGCKIISHGENKGKGQAMRTGLANSAGQYIVFIDADGTYPPEEIPRIISLLNEYDAVFTARDQKNIPRFNLFGNKIISFIIRIFSDFDGHDPLSGFYGMRRLVAEELDLESDDFSVETEIAIKTSAMGFKTTEIPIKYERRLGQSKLSPFKDGWKILKLIGLLAVRYNPLVTFVLPGAFLCLIGLIFFFLTSAGDFYLTGNVVLGVHAFIFSVMAFLVGSQIIIQGVIMDLYAVRQKYKKPDIIFTVFHPSFFRGLLALGLIIAAVGLVLAVQEVWTWISGGFQPYFETRRAATILLLNLFGLQLIFSSLIGREIKNSKC